MSPSHGARLGNAIREHAMLEKADARACIRRSSADARKALRVGDCVRYMGGGRCAGTLRLPGGVLLKVGDFVVIRSIPGPAGDLGCQVGGRLGEGTAEISLNIDDIRVDAVTEQATFLHLECLLCRVTLLVLAPLWHP